MNKFKNYYFEIHSVRDQASLEELKFCLDSLDIDYDIVTRYLMDYKTKRAMMFIDTPEFVKGRLMLTPIYESPSLLEEQVRNWVVESVAFKVNLVGLTEEVFADLDDFINLFIKNNFRRS